MAVLVRAGRGELRVLVAALSLAGFGCGSDQGTASAGETGGTAQVGGGAGVGGNVASASGGATSGGVAGSGVAGNTTPVGSGGAPLGVGGMVVGTGGAVTGVGGLAGVGGLVAAGGATGLGQGGAGPGSGGATTGAGGNTNSTCVAGVQTGDACDPTADAAVCVRSTRNCTCGGAADPTWTCVSSDGAGGSGAGGMASVGGASAGGATAGGATAGGATAGGATAGGATGVGGGGPIATGVEDPGMDCAVGAMPSPSSLVASDKLPDPFTKMNGEPMTSKSEWWCRREEILQLGYEFIYGEKPIPTDVSGSVTDSEISVSVSDGGSTTFSATVELPSSGQAPYPAVIGVGGGMFGLNASLVSELKSRGVAVIVYDPYTVGAENGGGASVSGSGAFYSVYGSSHPGGLLTAWAWGVSRLIDVIEKNPSVIDPTKIGVAGCSRFGKAALVSGAFDGRIALTIPIESGIGGTPALRLVSKLDSYSGSEQPQHAVNYQPWFSPSQFYQFISPSDTTAKLPVDMHETIGLVAPRGLLILDNPSGNYNGLDRNSAYVTAVIGAKIFEGLGVPDNITYQGASGDHCAWRSQYTQPLVANVEKFLKGDGAAATGTFDTDLGGSKDPESHVEWSVPDLSGDL